MPVTLAMTSGDGDEPPKLPALVEHAVYRVVQEALTNVRKHAGDAETRIEVRHTPQELRLSVTNRRGRTDRDPQLPSGGHGLLGIAERIRLLGGELTARAAPRQRLQALTAKEREVLVALGAGLSNTDIAAALRMSEATAKTHISRILTKLNATNRVQAAILAHHAGLLD